MSDRDRENVRIRAIWRFSVFFRQCLIRHCRSLYPLNFYFLLFRILCAWIKEEHHLSCSLFSFCSISTSWLFDTFCGIVVGTLVIAVAVGIVYYCCSWPQNNMILSQCFFDSLNETKIWICLSAVRFHRYFARQIFFLAKSHFLVNQRVVVHLT